MSNRKVIISPINLRKDRLPPGQRWVDSPILYDISENFSFQQEDFAFKCFGEVERNVTLTFDDFLKLPQVELIADFHCVTHWSVKEIHWQGVQTKEIMELIQPKSDYVMVHSYDGYTTNTLTKYLFEEDVILAYGMGGTGIPSRHGYPLRLVIPKLYAWKSAKYVSGFEFIAEEKLGYLEERGYHRHGDPWKNERYG